MDKKIKHKIENISNYSLNDIDTKIKQGARFVLFNYRIGLGLFSILRVSPAILILNNDEFIYFKNRYNLKNLIFGIWHFPKGPFLVYDAFKINQNGGIDVTKDIMININNEVLVTKEIEISKIDTLFSKLKKSDVSNIHKGLSRVINFKTKYEVVYGGLFVNVDRYEEPYFVLGFKMYRNESFNKEEILKCLYKEYYKHVVFEIIELNNDLYSEKLIEQGNKII